MAWSIGEKKGETKRTGPSKVVDVRTSARDASDDEQTRVELGSERNLAGGMEMLEQDFLLSVIENTIGADRNDVMMRKLVFHELLRREQLDAIDSNSLKIYAVNEGNLYGKDIQCEAMKKLTERTARKVKDSS